MVKRDYKDWEEYKKKMWREWQKYQKASWKDWVSIFVIILVLPAIYGIVSIRILIDDVCRWGTRESRGK